ncbi:DddA-like double-stranded DNA deaminase toxin [Micromonospora wenchangensis]|uniref:DddA-like double-stranded DNA deaminase toxin n=1 Tax=Micromonospora wenchangensis TaxID=1185415 RepID=UPI0033C522D0
MRRDHLSEAVVVTNNPLCDHTPYGCEKILSQLLPAGTNWRCTYATMTGRSATGAPTPETKRRSHEGDLDLRPGRPARQPRGRTQRP